MQTIVSTGEDGTLVAQNMDNLSGGITAGQTEMIVNSDTFDAGDVVIIDQERLYISIDDEDGSYTVTRGYESTTAAAHDSGSNVFLKGGTTVLTHTFDGSTLLSKIRINAMERDVAFAIEVDGTIKYRVPRSPYGELEWVTSFRPYIPDSGTVIKLICWTLAGVNINAVMES